MKKVLASSIILFFLTALLSCKNESSSKSNSKTTAHLISQSEKNASCVYLTNDLQGKPVISWVEIDTANAKKEFYFAVWNTKKQNFQKRQNIPIPKNTSIHEEGMPKIAFKGNGKMVAFFETSTPAPGERWGVGDILMIQSSDKGKTWTQPTSIFPEKPKAASISFSGITRLPGGEIGITCLGTNKDTSLLGRPILFIKTKAKGFRKPVVINPEACECCRTAVSVGNNGRISVAYRDLQQGSIRDIFVSTSIDGGLLFHHDKDINKIPWKINGCPHNGPSIATQDNKNFVAWSTGGKNAGVHYAKLTSSGENLQRKNISKDGRFIQLCLLPESNNTRITVYDEVYSRDGEVFSRIKANAITDTSFLEMNVTKDSAQASHPVVTPIDSKNMIVAWSEGHHAIYYRKIQVKNINKKAEEFETSVSFAENSSKKKLIADVVCDMQISSEMIADSLTYRGKMYYFCSDHCENSFLKSPERYTENKK